MIALNVKKIITYKHQGDNEKSEYFTRTSCGCLLRNFHVDFLQRNYVNGGMQSTLSETTSCGTIHNIH